MCGDKTIASPALRSSKSRRAKETRGRSLNQRYKGREAVFSAGGGFLGWAFGLFFFLAAVSTYMCSSPS